jgi:hypothetical protein
VRGGGCHRHLHVHGLHVRLGNGDHCLRHQER